MLNLLIVSFIWAFSFGLIKGQLTSLDANFVAAARLGLSLLVFLPFLRLRGLPRGVGLRLAMTGALQYGVMYIAYLYAFQYLQAYEVALFTIFTPIYVTLINDAARRRFQPVSLLAALLAVGGSVVVQQASLMRTQMLAGFIIVQVSNLAFAGGQIAYRQLLASRPVIKDRQVFALLYLGGALTALVPALFTTPWHSLALSASQAWSLLYLGVIASGLAFFLWNTGARRVNAGALAVLNNLKIPLAVAVSLLVFGEQAHLPSLLLGGAVMLAALALNAWGVRKF